MEVCIVILLLGTVAMAKGPVAAPDKPIRVCVLDSPPTVGLKNGVKLNDGQSLTPSAAKDNLQGMGIDMVVSVGARMPSAARASGFVRVRSLPGAFAPVLYT